MVVLRLCFSGLFQFLLHQPACLDAMHEADTTEPMAEDCFFTVTDLTCKQ